MPYLGRELTSGNYLKLDDISSQFDGSTVTFQLKSGGSDFFPGSSFSLLVSVAGIIQEADSAYQINNNEITFATAPGASDDAFSDGTSGDSEYRGMIQYGHNNDSMRFSTSATERFRIDSSGNVTKPTSFHILVDRDGNQTGYSATGTTGAVIWNRVRTSESSPNAANHFNTSTGIFTAPVTGLYFFHAAVNCNYNVEGAWLILNGSRPNFSVFNPNSAQTSDGAITYHLTAGDEVGLKWYQNGGTNRTINSNVLHTWWRIILLG